jgi:hypothetical protein
MTFSTMKFSIMTFGIITLRIMTFGIMTLSMMTLSMMTLSIKGLFVTFSIKNVIHYRTHRKIMVTFIQWYRFQKNVSKFTPKSFMRLTPQTFILVFMLFLC